MQQQIPPETSNLYMAIGYLIVVLILIGIVGFMVNRARQARAEIRMLEELERDEQKPKRQ